MNARIVNLYNNDALPGRGLQASHGNAFAIEIGGQRILFDTGWHGRILLANMRELGVSPDDIDQVVLSHGHLDHSGGLAAFLQARADPVPIVCHPDALQPRMLRWRFGLRVAAIGFPRLNEAQKRKAHFILTREPYSIAKGLTTTGEIRERPERACIAPQIVRRANGRWEEDPVADDLSLVLETQGGLVLITGCCHAGLLNTCAHVTRQFAGQSIRAIIGGTHMVALRPSEVCHTARMLQEVYGAPTLYLDHCTGREAIAQLREHLGPDHLHDFWVGSEATYELP